MLQNLPYSLPSENEFRICHFYAHTLVNTLFPYRLLSMLITSPHSSSYIIFTSDIISRREGPRLLHLTCLVHVRLDLSQVLLVLVSQLSVQPSDEQSASCPGSSSACRILLFPIHPAQR